MLITAYHFLPSYWCSKHAKFTCIINSDVMLISRHGFSNFCQNLTIWKNKRYLNPFHVQNLAPWISLHPLIGCSAWCAFIYTHRPYLLPAFLLASVKLFDNNNTRGSLNKIGVGWCWRRGFGEVVRFASRYKNQLYRSI